MRDYGVDGQIGLENTPDEYVEKLVKVFHEVRRVLRDDGTLWLNLGDSYAGSYKGFGNDPKRAKYTRQADDQLPGPCPKIKGLKPKDLIGIPWRVAFALQADGWYLRQDIIWHKPNTMPESVKDRCTKSHEYIFLLSKSEKYYCDMESIKEPAISNHKPGNKNHKYVEQYYLDSNEQHRTKAGLLDLSDTVYEKRNRRSVWTVSTKPFKGAHFAVFPPDLVAPCILAGCPENGIVIDPFIGSGTTAVVAKNLNRNYLGIELNPEYIEIAKKRIGG